MGHHQTRDETSAKPPSDAVSETSRHRGASESIIDFRTKPDQYRHWRLRIEPPVAYLTMDVDEEAPLRPDYRLKQNSYDLGVDIELYDATQRLRFEHPEVRVVVVESGRERIFCSGANIGMLGASSHQLKVNFCKFTNETRLAIEDASANSGQRYVCVVQGTAAGGGYEIAMACDHIVLADDGSSAVSLPEVPLLGVLPGTGGLTRLVDKRGVRRDLADVFCTLEEGVKGERALEWKLVDELARRSELDEVVRERAREMAAQSDRPEDGRGATLRELERRITSAASGVSESIEYRSLRVALERDLGAAELTVVGPDAPPASEDAVVEDLFASADGFWPLEVLRELDDALLHLRVNEPELGLLVLRSAGCLEHVMAYDALLHSRRDHWLVREVLLYAKRVLKRLDVSSRSLFALIDPGSCFGGWLLELALAADRQYMFEGEPDDESLTAPEIALGELSFGSVPMPNGLSRLEVRLGEVSASSLRADIGRSLDARAALERGLVTEVFDDIDWDDEIRLVLEERASFSPDALSAMESNLRFAGPETMESKIFGRLSAWQNWVFVRPNAVGEEGALSLYGTGRRPRYDRERV